MFKTVTLAAACLAATTPALAAPNLPDCGGEGQRTCSWTDQEYYDMGSRACEYDLKASGSQCVNEKRRVWDRRDAWLEWVLKQQRYGISAGEPLSWVPTMGAHNAYSSTQQGFANDQSNQTYSITDQLRMGARFLELDPHQTFFNELALCHSSVDPCGSTTRQLAYGFMEIRRWLDDNPDEVLFIKLDDHVGTAADDLLTLVDTYFGDKLVPRAGDPGAWPSIAKVRSLGKQVLLATRSQRIATSNLLWYFDGSYATSNDHPNQFNIDACTDGDGRRVADRGTTRWSVVAEGRNLSNYFDATGLVASRSDVQRYLKCGVAVVAIDFIDALLAPAVADYQSTDRDLRISGSAWTYEPGDYGTQGPPVLRADTGRWQSRPATEFHPYLCQVPGGAFNERRFVVTTGTGPWNRGAQTCTAEFPGSRFTLPTLPMFNEVARTTVAAKASEAWVNYAAIAQRDPLVSPSSATFTAPVGTSPTAGLTSTLYGRTGERLVAKADADWALVSLPDGDTALEQGNRLVVRISDAAKSFAPGTYTTAVALGYQGLGRSNEVQVTLTIQAVGTATLSLTRSTVRQPETVRLSTTLSSGSPSLPVSGGEVQLKEIVPSDTGGEPRHVLVATRPVQGSGSSVQVDFDLNSLDLGQGQHRYVTSYTGSTHFTPFDSNTRVLQVQPRVVVLPESMAFRMPVGGPLPASQLLKVGTPGTEAGKFPGWAGATPNGGDYDVAIHSSALSLAAGVYDSTFVVTDGRPGEATVPLTLTVQSPLQLSARSASLSARTQPTSTSFSVLNPDGRPLRASSSASWLQVTLSKPTAPAAAVVTANPAGLTAGRYEGRVTLRSAWAASAAVYKVTFTVNP